MPELGWGHYSEARRVEGAYIMLWRLPKSRWRAQRDDDPPGPECDSPEAALQAVGVTEEQWAAGEKGEAQT